MIFQVYIPITGKIEYINIFKGNTNLKMNYIYYNIIRNANDRF